MTPQDYIDAYQTIGADYGNLLLAMTAILVALGSVRFVVRLLKGAWRDE